ncbi:VOC family protein [Flavonifractor sp. An82]|uniref:VOC family protein n=1 Tax=Flavonifractor sp. An82 TaxID=1965660 RepID=UPI000B3A7526|nr:VOC family protein [Flavonifractor sp. An82]OUN20093.1 hypothetical protein B5G34_16090 [Flavonifractor sp. An82]
MTYKALHVGISVLDMDAALAWYAKNLDFALVQDEYVPALKARVCFLQNREFQLELFRYDAPKPLPQERLTPNSDLQTVGTKHVAFEVPDMQALKEKFVANGVDIAHEIRMENNNVMFVRDNSGVLIEFIQKN